MILSSSFEYMMVESHRLVIVVFIKKTITDEITVSQNLIINKPSITISNNIFFFIHNTLRIFSLREKGDTP